MPVELGDECIKQWYSESNTKIIKYWSLTNSIMLSSFSEYWAFIPYLLRSLRIKKMFEAREKYSKENKIPRIEIQRWSEWRMIILLSSFLGSITVLVTILVLFDFDKTMWFISSFYIGGFLNHDGIMKGLDGP